MSQWEPAANAEWDAVRPVVATGGVSRLLHVHEKAATKAIRAGLVGPVYRAARGEFVETAAVERLGGRVPTALEDLPPTLIVKVGGPAVDGDPDHWPDPHRVWRGWHEAAPADEQLAASTRWWKVASPDELIGQLLTVVVAHWPVTVRRIESVETVRGWGSAFDTSAVDHGITHQFLTSRLEGLPGGTIERSELDRRRTVEA